MANEKIDIRKGEAPKQTAERTDIASLIPPEVWKECENKLRTTRKRWEFLEIAHAYKELAPEKLEGLGIQRRLRQARANEYVSGALRRILEASQKQAAISLQDILILKLSLKVYTWEFGTNPQVSPAWPKMAAALRERLQMYVKDTGTLEGNLGEAFHYADALHVLSGGGFTPLIEAFNSLLDHEALATHLRGDLARLWSAEDLSAFTIIEHLQQIRKFMPRFFKNYIEPSSEWAAVANDVKGYVQHWSHQLTPDAFLKTVAPLQGLLRGVKVEQSAEPLRDLPITRAY